MNDLHIEGAIMEWESYLRQQSENPEGNTTVITKERVKAVLGDSPLIDDELIQDMFATANSDAHEGAEWLPYYKLALGVLAQAFGGLEAVAREGLKHAAGNQDFDTDSFAKLREGFDHCRWLFRLHLRPIGIGPDESQERAAAVDASIAEELE